ncbi:hypothetical protein VMCG_05888 [Cytospora schulzeri]|uniref:ABM domain-containing protein n=1 Tax=Cytospora schulzeri TaxID=448051 RepID=A0A423WD99_9PEZI|nr:hypothetical protein VMCG_05888 [Valsa malicola]
MAITEIGCVVLKPGVDVIDESTPGSNILVTAWKKITSQPTGPFRIYWGLEVENPSNLWSFFDFASVEEHQQFGKEFGGDIVKDFDKIVDHGVFTGNKHIATNPYPPSALRSPVTEILLAWFPSDISPELKDANTKKLEQFAEMSLKACSDIQAINLGWGLENDFLVRGGDEGEKGSMASMLIGWPSIDAHVRFRDTDAFKEAIPLVRGLEGKTKMTMFHVKAQVMENKARKE